MLYRHNGEKMETTTQHTNGTGLILRGTRRGPTRTRSFASTSARSRGLEVRACCLSQASPIEGVAVKELKLSYHNGYL